MLQALALTKRYGDFTALQPLDLRIEAGEVFCLLGANGAGKSTTIQLFLGFIAPSGGRVEVDGIDVGKRPLETRRRIAYIPENVHLYPNLSGLENLEFFTALSGREAPPQAELLEALDRAGLPSDAVHKRVGAYSKGLRQKVGIAMAMTKGARALLLDEPTSGLDPKASNEFSRLIQTMSADGVAVLMATHDIFRSKEVGHRVGIMKRGVLCTTMETEDLSHADLESIYLEHMTDA